MNQEISFADIFSRNYVTLISGLEDYRSPYAKTVGDPSEIIESLIQSAALKSAAVSATLSLPPGPFGWLTVIPELFFIYRIQGHLIKDVATLYGRDAKLTKELMLYCMFKHGGSHLFRRVVEEASARVIIRPSTIGFFEMILTKIGIRVSKKFIQGGLIRWIPLIGAALTGSFAYLDTRNVGKTANEMLAKEIIVIPAKEIQELEMNATS